MNNVFFDSVDCLNNFNHFVEAMIPKYHISYKVKNRKESDSLEKYKIINHIIILWQTL